MNAELKKIEREKCKAISQNKWKEAADASNYIGSELFRLAQYTEALKYHEEELTYNEMISDQLGIAVANRKLGECYTELGSFKKALSHIKTFLEIAVSIKNKVEEQRAWATLGRTFYLKYVQEREGSGNDSINSKALDQAEKSYLEALELSESVKSELSSKEYAEMKARCLLNLGLVCEWKGDITQCAENIRHAIFLASKYNLHEDLHRCQSSLAAVYQKHEQYTPALRLLDGAIASARKLNDKTLLYEELMAKAGILIAMKDFEGARYCLKKAYKLHSATEADEDKIEKHLRICIGLCNSQRKLQELNPSQNYEQKFILEKIADGLSSLEHYKLALEFYFATLKCMEEENFASSQKAPIYFSIAMTYKDIGNNIKAVEYLKMELDCYGKEPTEQVKTLWKISEILEETDEVEQLEKNYIKAASIAQKTSSNKILLNSLTKLLNFYEKNQMTEKAETIRSKLNSSAFEDLSSDESEVEEESQDPFDDIRLSELSDLRDSDSENEDVNVRSKRRVKKPSLKVNEKGETPLHQACINGNLTVVKRLVESGHPVNTRDFCGWTPLHEACNYGFYEIVEYLLDKGAAVNDRGGPKCEGITPLHDAASLGHIDVMRLLISRGASVTAVDDNGSTVLQRLVEMRKANQDDLDAESLRQCIKMEEELKIKMAQAGQPAKNGGSHDETDDVECFDNIDFSDNCTVNSDPIRLSEKRARSSSSSSELDTDDDIESSTPVGLDNSENNWSDAKKAKSEYQAVMSNLRRSAKSVIADPSPLQPSKTDKKSALVDEDEVGHDWLIKDIGQVQKVKKKRKMSRLTVRTSKSLYNYLTPNDESMHEDKETFAVDEDNSSVSHSNVVGQTQPLKNVTENNAPPSINRNDTSKLSFCIKVRIADKLILVPILEDSCSIGWLAEQAAQRYQDLVGSRPHLTLMTKDGALLSKSDLVKALFVNNEEITSCVEFWDEPSLEERYAQLCNKHGLKVLSSIQKRFVNFDASSDINFANCSIQLPQLSIVFSALKHYKNLQYLDISGTIITDMIACEIISCFPSFSSLISLNMSCCCLTSETAKNISQYFLNQTNSQMKLPRLKILNLSQNVFNSDCSVYFDTVLQLNSLRILHLCSCNLIPSFFEDRNLCRTLYNSVLEELNIAGNTFSNQSINCLINSLPKKSLKKFDLSHTIQQSNSCMLLISNFLTSGLPLLQEISLEDCHLNNDDLFLLLKSAPYCPQLKSLNISSNSDLSCTTILDFLTVMLNVNNTLSNISLTGTCLWDMKNMLSLIDILNKASNICCIMLDNIPESCEEKLLQFWKNRFGNKASCLASSFCKLSIV
ncbi:tonsoku-like protein [Trichonephila clavipes]|uniref:Tonsoku-like protein n=2 Tax=Trichonephila clavipes TaxID=2585209 RepID=A0A8X6WFH7_TRICX|nr:tonsoku-like protein [Trichonephila clavipes]